MDEHYAILRMQNPQGSPSMWGKTDSGNIMSKGTIRSDTAFIAAGNPDVWNAKEVLHSLVTDDGGNGNIPENGVTLIMGSKYRSYGQYMTYGGSKPRSTSLFQVFDMGGANKGWAA